MPLFSVILPTRNRPQLFERALQSVLDQTFQDREVVTVVDGSDTGHLESYRMLEARYPDVRFLYLLHRPNGHGQSYSSNVGAAQAKGDFLCFLDDDDFWTDESYLANVADNIAASEVPVDVHYANQHAYYPDGKPKAEKLWLGNLATQTGECRRNLGDSFVVDCAFLLRGAGFAHLNCSIFRRAFYQDIGGMDESIRYENDREVYIRAIDSAQRILYSTRFVSHHNIPDPGKRSNMSTVGTDTEKKLYQLRVYDKGICFCQKPEIVRFCRRGKTYELKHLATTLYRQGRYRSAAVYAWEALSSGFNPRWLAYCLRIAVLSLLRGNRD